LSQTSRQLHFKLCVVGDGGVGKTTLINRFLSGSYLADLKMTIGVDFHIHKRERGDKSISFQIWDLGGQERFQKMRVFDRYVHGSHAIMIAFDLSRIDTFENLPKWLELAQKAVSNPVLILVGTKHDLNREVDSDLIEAWINEHGISQFIETSALTGENINELFENVITELLQRFDN
jgi:small GTP-binding protein